MVFPQSGTLQPRHPSQLYEFLLEGLALFALLWWYRRHERAQGQGLAARASAEIGHAHAGLGIHHQGDQLAAFILDFHQARHEGRAAGDRAPPVNAQAPR